MNRKLGLWSAVAVTAAVVAFGSLMLLRLDYGAYAASMAISWTYLLLVCSFYVAAGSNEKVAALAGVAFGTLYAGFVTCVYFIQLTSVLNQTASADNLALLTYQELGSPMFNLDLLGYGLMAVSTLFIGLTIVGTSLADRWLRLLLIVHGAFAPMCVVLPISNVFGAMPSADGDATGVAVLLFWCVYFIPVGILSIYHFSTAGQVVEELPMPISSLLLHPRS